MDECLSCWLLDSVVWLAAWLIRQCEYNSRANSTCNFIPRRHFLFGWKLKHTGWRKLILLSHIVLVDSQLIFG